MGRNCSDALNALVSRIVCAVGFREAIDVACVLLAPALLPLVVLLEPAGLVLLEAPDLVPLPWVFPVEPILLLITGFVVSPVELCVCRATPPCVHSTIIPT